MVEENKPQVRSVSLLTKHKYKIILATLVVLVGVGYGLVRTVSYFNDKERAKREQFLSEFRAKLGGDSWPSDITEWEKFAEYTENKSEKARAHQELASLHYSSGNKQRALDELLKAEKFWDNPSEQDYRSIAMTAREVGNKEVAKEYFQKALAAVDPGSPNYEQYKSYYEQLISSVDAPAATEEQFRQHYESQ